MAPHAGGSLGTTPEQLLVPAEYIPDRSVSPAYLKAKTAVEPGGFPVLNGARR